MVRNVVKICPVIALAGLAALAPAATFSFASDAALNDASVFVGGAGSPGPAGSLFSLTDGGSALGGSLPLAWLGDPDGAQPQAPLSFAGAFDFADSGAAKSYQRTQVGNNWLHVYSFGGSFSLLNAGATYLTVAFSNATLTTMSASPSTWGTAAAIQCSEATSLLTFTPSPELQALGFGQLNFQRNFSFALSTILTELGSSVMIDPETGRVLDSFSADSSFTAGAIPAPGPIALSLAAGAALLWRRKR